jgi:hypothetical protein
MPTHDQLTCFTMFVLTRHPMHAATWRSVGFNNDSSTLDAEHPVALVGAHPFNQRAMLLLLLLCFTLLQLLLQLR